MRVVVLAVSVQGHQARAEGGEEGRQLLMGEGSYLPITKEFGIGIHGGHTVLQDPNDGGGHVSPHFLERRNVKVHFHSDG